MYQEVVRDSKLSYSQLGRGLGRVLVEKLFNIFSPENICRSTLQQDYSSDGTSLQSGTFGFSRLIDLSPAEVSFLGIGSFMERLLLFVMRSNRECLNGLVDMLMEDEDCTDYTHIGKENVRAVTRMLLVPSKSETNALRRKFSTGAGDAPFEALITSHEDRLLNDIKLLHSVYSFIPRTRAPPVRANAHLTHLYCS